MTSSVSPQEQIDEEGTMDDTQSQSSATPSSRSDHRIGDPSGSHQRSPTSTGNSRLSLNVLRGFGKGKQSKEHVRDG